MKTKKLFRAFLGCVIILSLILSCAPTSYAKKNVESLLFDFETYEGTWAGDSTYTAPVGDAVGKFSAYNGTSALHGLEAGTPTGDSSYGVSVMQTHKPDPDDTQKKIYAGLLYTFNSNYYIFDTIHVEFSYYAQTNSTNNKQAPRMLRFYGPGSSASGASSGAVTPITFGGGNGGGNITVNGSAIGTWKTETWYDVDLLYNFHTKDYSISVTSDEGDKFSDAGIMTSAGNMYRPNRMEFFTTFTSTKLKTEGYGDQVYFWDNIKVGDDWRCISSNDTETAVYGDCFDFEDMAITEDGSYASGSMTGDLGSQLAMTVTSESSSTYGLTPTVVYESKDSDNKMLNLVSHPGQTYSQVTYYPKKAIDDTLYFKTTVRVDDDNLGTFNIYAHNYLWCAVNIRTGYVHALGDNTAKNRLIPYETGKPFDVEIKIDMKSGYYEISASDGTNSGTKTGYYYQDIPSTITYKDVTHSKMLLRFVGKKNKDLQASVTIDNIQGGNLPEMEHNPSVNYDFESSAIAGYIVDSAGKQTGLSISDGKLGISDENKIVVRFPFKDKGSIVTADVTLSDFNSPKKLRGWVSKSTSSSSYDFEDILTIDESGYVYASGSEEAMNETPLTAGDYTFSADYSKATRLLSYTFTKKDDSSIALEGECSFDNLYSGLAFESAAPSDSASTTSLAIDNLSIKSYVQKEFAMDYENSTTGSKKKVLIDDSAYMRFTNPLNFEAIGVDDISFPYGGPEEFTLSKQDDYTLKIDFEKEKSTHYHICVNATDIYGATLTDYIEFDTEPNLYEIGSIVFSDNTSDNLPTIVPGEVTSSVSYYSGDGVARNAIMWTALYCQDGSLCDVKLKHITFDSEEKTESTTVVVPDDSKAYKIKTGIMSHSLKPLAYDEVATKIVIYKLDDLKYGEDYAQKCYEQGQWALENDVKLAFGLVVGSLEEKEGVDKTDYYNMVKDIAAMDSVEVWCHGYTHIQTIDEDGGYHAEFNAPLDEQIATLQNCVDTAYEKVGITLESLGVPHGITSDDLTAALEAFPQFKTLIGSGSTLRVGKTFVHLPLRSPFEVSTGVLHPLEKLKSEYLSRTGLYEYVLFEGHSPYWNDESFETFKALTQWLKDQKTVSMTPTEYYNFLNL